VLLRGTSSVLLLAGVMSLFADCQKVPITDINAAFSLADATWFEEEQTLFVFYQVDAQQGINPDSQIEITYRTDDVFVDWTPLNSLPSVHTHIPVGCGPHSLCGSWSLKIAKEPRDVALHLRWAKNGELSLDSGLVLHVVGSGPPYLNRSLLVYGVFDADNQHVQWRSRNQFPALRNEQAEQYGLRRDFRIETQAYGETNADFNVDPYGYGFDTDCPASLTALGFPVLETTDRAVFETNDMPLAASTFSTVCAHSVVTDGLGTFAAPALARKNPEVRPAFPVLRSPILQDTQIGFVLHPCQRTISDVHLAMQKQRLLLSNFTEICIDDLFDPSLAATVEASIRSQIELTRPAGNDMTLTLALHHDDQTGTLDGIVEQALANILPGEALKSSPRVTGAFVFDSFSHQINNPIVSALALWCPAPGDSNLKNIPDSASRSCALEPDPDLVLGPFTFSELPILPSRDQYLNFVNEYSVAEAGTMQTLTFSAPKRTPLSTDISVGQYGLATFFNDEVFNAQVTDAFSFCPSSDPRVRAVVFVSAGNSTPQSLSQLPTFQMTTPETEYALGLVWDFPFLLHLQYREVLAGAGAAYGFSIPFGIGTDAQTYYGGALWTAPDFPLQNVLLQCTRFCDDPTFDDAGVYNVGETFRLAYANNCYQPSFPAVGNGGFPSDP
jgi:hypothetical protein